MAVDERVVASIIRTVMILVEKQVAKPIMDECIFKEFHPLGLMRLATANNYRTSLRHTAEILHLVGLRTVSIVFEVLEGGDDQVAFRPQASDLLSHPIIIASHCPGLR